MSEGPIPKPDRRERGERADPLRLQAALRTVQVTVSQRISGRVSELTGLVLRATAPGARIGELVAIDRLNEPADIDPQPLSMPSWRRGTTNETPLYAEVVGFRGEEVVLLPLGSVAGVGPNSVVRPTGMPLTILAGTPLLGRVVDAYGEAIDDGPPLSSLATELIPTPVERDAPEPLRRRRITEPLSFGLRAIDGCLTIGQGQRLGLFAGPGLGKSTLLGQIARNASSDVTVIGLIGERGREVRDFIDRELDDETRRRTVVVCATSDQPPLLRLKAALSATAIAEHFRDRGKKSPAAGRLTHPGGPCSA